MAGANWRCTACDIYNGPAAKACQVCDTERSTPPIRKPSPARPSGDWNCTQCGTNNGQADLSCIGCATGWKTATKKAAPKKPSPRKPAAKKLAAAKTTTAKKTTTPRKTTTKKTTTDPTVPRGTATPRPTSPPRTEPTEVFYPSASGGYAPPSATPAPPPPAPAPPYTPPPYTPPYRPPSYRPPTKRTSKGKSCGLGCLGVFAVMFLLPLMSGGCDALMTPDSDDSGSGGTTSTAASCPGRIAEAIPSGDGAELVKAFRTKNKQITLCRTSGGRLYYYGEFSDHREPGIAMRAKETSDGYEARNDPYSYRIDGDAVTIYRDGNRIGRETLSPEPSPS